MILFIFILIVIGIFFAAAGLMGLILLPMAIAATLTILGFFGMLLGSPGASAIFLVSALATAMLWGLFLVIAKKVG